MSIVAAVIRYADGVLSLPPPNRHLDIVAVRDGVTDDSDVRGFITDTGEFLGRREAAAHACGAGQVKALRSPPGLTTDDLW